MLCDRHVDKIGMYFQDRLEEQNVLKRRRPSPVKKAKRLPAPLEKGFTQDVWPRQARKGTASGSGKFRRIRQSLLAELIRGISPGNVEKPKKRKSAAVNNAASGRTATASTVSDSAVTGNIDTENVRPNLFSGLRIPLPWLRKLVIGMGILAAAIIGLSWDGMPGMHAAQPDISPASLEDPFSPLSQRIPEFTPMQSLSWDIPHMAEYPRLAYTDIPLNLTETFAWAPHVVAPGETISGIAVRHAVSQESIIALNDIRETWNLQAGRTLRIPNMNGIPYTVQANDTLEGIAQSMNIPLNVLLDANDIYDDNIATGRVLFIPGGRMDANELRRAIRRPAPERMVRPLGGRITSGFGWREDPFSPGSGRMQLHRAVDIAGRIGDPVRAAMMGTVMHRGANPTYGNFIVLQHGYYQTLYAHLSAFSVAVGDTVRQGQEIGRVGISGRTTGPHLHFAVFYRGEPINPVDRWR